MQSIFTRRSVRQFSAQIVESEKIEKLLRAGMQAPSASNQQPWEFIVVRGKENIAMLSKYNPYAGCLKGANLAIILLGNTQRMISADHWQQDMGASTQNILLEAIELGLGAVWLGTAPNPRMMQAIRNLYDLPQNLMPYSVLAIGYPQNASANHFVDRYDACRVRYIG